MRCFHGDISAQDAHRTLHASMKSGSYLLRFSSEIRAVTMSILREDGGCDHGRIFRRGEEYVCGDINHRTLRAVMKDVSKRRPDSAPLVPCGGTPFEAQTTNPDYVFMGKLQYTMKDSDKKPTDGT